MFRGPLPLDVDDLSGTVLDDELDAVGELVLDPPAADRVRSITLIDETGRQLTVDLRHLVGHNRPVSVFWDAGIVEVLRDGRAGVWTDLSLGPVREIWLRHGRGDSGDMTVWTLTATSEET